MHIGWTVGEEPDLVGNEISLKPKKYLIIPALLGYLSHWPYWLKEIIVEDEDAVLGHPDSLDKCGEAFGQWLILSSFDCFQAWKCIGV